MVATLERVIEAALALTESERVELVTALISTLSLADATQLDETWLAEINRRSEEFDSGSVVTVSWTDVKDKARRRLASHG